MKADKTNKQTNHQRGAKGFKKHDKWEKGRGSQERGNKPASYYVGCRGSKKRSTGSLGCRRSSLKTATKEKKTKNQSESETKENNFKKMLPNNTI